MKTDGAMTILDGEKGEEMKHTPGPWEVSEGNMGPKGDTTVHIETTIGGYICSVEGHTDKEMQEKGYFSLEEMNANAYLIAAAPKLLAACKEALLTQQVLQKSKSPFRSKRVLEQIEQAIKSVEEK